MKEHPPLERLLAYAGLEAGDAHTSATALHVGECPTCAGVVERYRAVGEVMRDTVAFVPSAAVVARAKALFVPPAPTTNASFDLLAPLRRIVADLVFDSGSGLSPAMPGFRGGGERLLSYEADAIEVDLRFEPPGEREQAWLLQGQIVAPALEAAGAVNLTESEGSEPVATTTADEHGVFTLSAPPGRYDLLAQLPDALLVLPGLELG